MPLTQNQFNEKWIINSLVSYLKTNVVTPYNLAVTTTDYPGQLGIELEFPDDPEKAPVMPLIVVPLPYDAKNQVSTGLADQTVWVYKTFRLMCYPALTTEGKASPSAAATLRNYINYSLGTGLYIPIYDYSSTPTLAENARIIESKIVQTPKIFAPLLAMEKYVFDFILTLVISVAAING